jgi:hypothetical protein
VKTRTLLILSALTATAILLAGIALFVVWGTADDVALPGLGVQGVAGDAVITPTDLQVTDGATVVTVDVAGVDDPDGFDSFGLVVAGSGYPVADTDCAGLTVEPQTCRLRFEVQADEASAVLVVRRGGELANWDLTRDEP